MKYSDTGEHTKNAPSRPHKGHKHAHGENCDKATIKPDANSCCEGGGARWNEDFENKVDECIDKNNVKQK